MNGITDGMLSRKGIVWERYISIVVLIDGRIYPYLRE